ncbi:hypothetical protein BC827DRAFT_1159372 [Russula dissimulans]|nr:hypothetical protein BC827DRAFT_1159372 [Russula dissimulans]
MVQTLQMCLQRVSTAEDSEAPTAKRVGVEGHHMVSVLLARPQNELEVHATAGTRGCRTSRNFPDRVRAPQRDANRPLTNFLVGLLGLFTKSRWQQIEEAPYRRAKSGVEGRRRARVVQNGSAEGLENRDSRQHEANEVERRVECMAKNQVRKCTLLLVLAVIECAQGQAYQHECRVCHHRRPVRARMKRRVLASVSAEGAISRLRVCCHRVVREGEASEGWLEIEAQMGSGTMPAEKILRQRMMAQCEKASETLKEAGVESSWPQRDLPRRHKVGEDDSNLTSMGGDREVECCAVRQGGRPKRGKARQTRWELTKVKDSKTHGTGKIIFLGSHGEGGSVIEGKMMLDVGRAATLVRVNTVKKNTKKEAELQRKDETGYGRLTARCYRTVPFRDNFNYPDGRSRTVKIGRHDR